MGISFYQSILWWPWRNVQCRASGQAAWAFRVTAAKQRHFEGLEDWSKYDSSNLVKWWKLNPFHIIISYHITSYLFTSRVSNCFQLTNTNDSKHFTTHQRASAEDRLSYGLQVVLCLLLWCFGVSAVPIYAKRIFDGSFGVKKLLGNGVLPCDTPKFSNHTRHSPMHSITDQHSTLKIHPRFPYPCFAAFLQLAFASVLLGCLHLMQHLWISRVSWQTFWLGRLFITQLCFVFSWLQMTRVM